MQQVEIRVKGHLDENWAKWLEGFDLCHTEPDETVLAGKVRDQAALYGLIAKLRDLGVSLIAVNIWSIDDNSPEEGSGP
jgi:hypothetical protein